VQGKVGKKRKGKEGKSRKRSKIRRKNGKRKRQNWGPKEQRAGAVVVISMGEGHDAAEGPKSKKVRGCPSRTMGKEKKKRRPSVPQLQKKRRNQTKIKNRLVGGTVPLRGYSPRWEKARKGTQKQRQTNPGVPRKLREENAATGWNGYIQTKKAKKMSVP